MFFFAQIYHSQTKEQTASWTTCGLTLTSQNIDYLLMINELLLNHKKRKMKSINNDRKYSNSPQPDKTQGALRWQRLVNNVGLNRILGRFRAL